MDVTVIYYSSQNLYVDSDMISRKQLHTEGKNAYTVGPEIKCSEIKLF